MSWPIAKRRLVLSPLIIGCGLGVCGWQASEHIRRRRNITQGLINRSRDITSTLGVLLRSQRRFGIVSKERLQPVLQDLVRPGELESIAILGADGGVIASAGTVVETTPDMLHAAGVYWHEHSLTIMNLMDLGANAGDEAARNRSPIVVTDERTARSFRPQPNRRPNNSDSASSTVPTTDN